MNPKGITARRRKRERRYARRHGYFWLPCPLCGTEFGGHEKTGMIATDKPDRHTSICPFCTSERQQAAEDALIRLGQHGALSTTRWEFDRCIEHRVGLNPTAQVTNGLVLRV